MNDALPSGLVAGAILRGREYAWEIPTFPRALQRAPGLGYACLGGQFWFLLPDRSVYEPFWLEANSSDRLLNETWPTYASRSCDEVMTRFKALLASTNFDEEAKKFAALHGPHRLMFNAEFVTEVELAALGNWNGLR